MIHDCPAVDKHCMFHHGSPVHYRPLQDKAASSHCRILADDCRRMNQSRNLIPCLHQLLCPEQAHIIISKGSHRRIIGLQKFSVVTAFSNDILLFLGVIQKRNIIIAQLQGGLLNHTAHTACPQYQQFSHFNLKRILNSRIPFSPFFAFGSHLCLCQIPVLNSTKYSGIGQWIKKGIIKGAVPAFPAPSMIA